MRQMPFPAYGLNPVFASGALFATLSVVGIWHYANPGLAVALLLAATGHLVLVLTRYQRLEGQVVLLQYTLMVIGVLTIVFHLLLELGPVKGFSSYLSTVPGVWLNGRAYPDFILYTMAVYFPAVAVAAITIHFRGRGRPLLSEVALTLFTANTLSFSCDFAIQRLTLHVYVYRPTERNAFGFFVGLATLEYAVAFHVIILAVFTATYLARHTGLRGLFDQRRYQKK